MFVENIYLRILVFVFFLFFLSSISFFSLWRGSVSLGFNINVKYIFFVTLGLFLFLFLGFFLGNLGGFISGIIYYLAVGLIYILLILIPLFLLRDIVSILYKIPALFMIIITSLYLIFGVYMGMKIKTTNLLLENTQLSRDYNIVFISDLHIQSLHSNAYAQKIVNKIQLLKPDFVLIGGDMLDRANPEYIKKLLPFAQIDVPIYAVLGNHEKIGGELLDLSLFADSKIKFLRNEKVFFEDIQLVGIDDKSFWDGKTLIDVLEESEMKQDALYTILLTHQPQKLSLIENYPIDLQLAGHTHRGQFIPLSWLIGLFNDYAYGEYNENGKTVFVTQGVGTWGAPVRIGTQVELVLLQLKK